MDQVKGTPKSLKQHVGEQLRFYKRKWKKDEELWITKNISSTVVRRKLEEQGDVLVREGRRNIESETIPLKKSYSMLAYNRDRLIDTILWNGEYYFDRMCVIPDPYDQAPLTAYLLFETYFARKVRYTVKGKTADGDFSYCTELKRQHRVPVFGLYAGCENEVRVDLLTKNDRVIKSRIIKIKTEPLPERLQGIVTKEEKKAPSKMPWKLISGGVEVPAFVIDEEGDIRWYTRRMGKAYGIFPLANGRFLYMEKYVDVPSYSVSQACVMYEMDYMGRIHHSSFYDKGFHHCAREMTPGGDLLIGSNSFDGYDENTIVRWDRQKNLPVDTINLGDLFDDTYRLMTDWVHVNSVCYIEKEDAIVVSMRNIHTVIKINASTKELIWVLSNPLMWKGTSVEDKVLKPVGEVKWIYQQHAAYQLEPFYDDGTKQVLVYDNHWARRKPVPFYDGDEAHSYLSVFTIDEEKMTVKMEDMVTVDNSRIRSNCIYDRENGRIFNMAGDLVPEIKENKGKIEEYDMQSKELLARYYIKTGFFTAYPFEPDLPAYEKPMEADVNYWTGSTPIMTPCEKQLLLDQAQLDAAFEVRFQEDMLLVTMVDHGMDYLYLVSEEQCYVCDLTNTYQTMKIFEDKVYDIPFWLKDIKSGAYQIYYEKSEKLFATQKEFKIQ